jgi:hypothetical protein
MSPSFISTTILRAKHATASTTLADAVVDAVIQLAYVAVDGVSTDECGTPGRATVSPVDVR